MSLSDVCSCSFQCQYLQDGNAGIGFDGEAGEVIQAGEGSIKDAKMPGNGCVRVKIKGRSHLISDMRYGHLFTVQLIIFILEVMHRPYLPWSGQGHGLSVLALPHRTVSSPEFSSCLNPG
jgi:hypothetical protein